MGTVDLFGGEKTTAPQVDLFGEDSQVDLFAGETEKEPGFLDHLGGMLANSPLIGTIQPDMVPSRITDQMALGAAGTVNALKSTWLTLPDNHAADASPEAQQEIARLKGDRKVSEELVKEIQAPDNAVARAVGDAAQSVPSSVVSLVPAAMGAPLGAAAGLGLAANYAVETATDYVNRQDEFNQPQAEAWAGANRHGAVATALEALPLHGAIKYMKGAAPIGKTMLKVGVGEGVSEGLTQAFDDVSTNMEGLTDLGLGEVTQRAGVAGLQGMLMTPMMGGVAHVVRAGQAHGVKVAQEKLLKELAFEEGPARTELDSIFLKAQAGTLGTNLERIVLPETPLTPEESVLADIQREQRAKGLDAAPTSAGAAFGALIDEVIGENQREGRTYAEEEQADEGGVTPYVQAGRERRYQPNLLPPSKRLINDAAVGGVLLEEMQGLTLEQTGDLQRGVVASIGGTEDIFPREVYSRLVQDLSTWVAKYMPEARIVLNLEQFAPEYQKSAFGLHQWRLTPEGMLHVITPRDLPGFKYQGGDQKTQVALLTAISHEFGHALKIQSLYQGMQNALGGELTARLREEALGGLVSPELLQVLVEKSPEEGALISTWQELRGKTLSGKLTAREFVDAWAGTRKLGADLYRTKAANKSLYSWAEDRLAGAGKSLDGATALELILAPFENSETKEAQDFLQEYLSLDEYMAEQFSRAAYTSGDLESSRTGTLFQNALGKLRQLFRDLKSWKGKNGEKIIAPGTTFQAWLDKQTLRAKEQTVREGKFVPSEAVKKARKKLEKKAKGEGKVSQKVEEPPPPEQVPVPLDIEVTAVPTREALESMAVELEASGAFYGSKHGEDRALVILRGKIKKGQFLEAKEMIEETLGRAVSWDREYSSTVLERLPQKKEFFKVGALEATLRAKDLKAKEVAFWERFLLAHPKGFSMDEAKEALEDELMPLELTYTPTYARTGLANIGLPSDRAQTVLLEAPFATDTDNHWKNPKYVSHARFSDVEQNRYVAEVQSDFWNPQRKNRMPTADLGAQEELDNVTDDLELAKSLYDEIEPGDTVVWASARSISGLLGISQQEAHDVAIGDPQELKAKLEKLIPELEAQLAQAQGAVEGAFPELQAQANKMEEMKGKWWERVVREMVSLAHEDGRASLLFASPDTMAKVEGWAQTLDFPELEGEYIQVRTAGGAELEIPFQGRVWDQGEGVALIATFRGEDFLVTDQRIYAGRETAVRSWGAQQGLYDLYKNGTAKFVRTKFRGELVKDQYGEWYKVDPKAFGSKVLNWDRENPVMPPRADILLADFAGKTEKQSAKEAIGFWERLGWKSPLFVNWFGDSKLVKGDGNPQGVWRGTGDRVSYLASGKAIWFEENPRKSKGGLEVGKLRKEGDSRQASPSTQEFFLRMENPLEKVLSWQVVGEAQLDAWAEEALAGGYDGLVVKEAGGGLDGISYAVFSPEQVVMNSSFPKISPTDGFHWDKDSPAQKGVQETSRLMENFWERGKLKTLNTAAKGIDMLMQLQQVAASQPGEQGIPINSFVTLNGLGMKMKNNLQVDAEALTKRMLHSSPGTVKELHKVLTAEWKGGALQGTLVGIGETGEVVWGGDAPTDHASRLQVVRWQVQDGLRIRQFLQSQGVDVETSHGKLILELYLETRNVFLTQFQYLERALHHKAESLYENSPSILKQEKWKIEEMLQKFRDGPFLPQGNFGNYVIIVQKDMGPQGKGKRRFQPVRREHFESKDAWQQAYKTWQAASRGDATLKVTSQVLEENNGVPMQLPNDFLESLGQTGEFTNEQLELMSQMMVRSRYEKLEARYSKIESKLEGANADFTRVFANYTLRNSNFIWKMYFQTSLRGAISQAKGMVRGLERDKGLSPEEQLALVDRQRRNIGLMEKSLEYMISPPMEFQQARLWITMAYLAFGVKTAALNASTMMNTWAAITTEYGEIQGNKIWAKSLYDSANLFRMSSRLKKAKGEELSRLMGVRAAYDQAVRDGVLDQSYAYFLAGQSNTGGVLGTFQNSWAGRAGHVFMEAGMLPFKTVEKSNRVTSLLAFYSAERALGTGHVQAYEIAVSKTNLLQNDYGAANKPQLMRGKRSILFMFASYTQFMGWVMLGGYERGARAKMKEAGRALPGVWHGTTVKLWLLFLALGGLSGLPFAENLLDLVQFMWRKVAGRGENLEQELRNLVQDAGGDPEVAVKGLMHNAWGFDLSGSFGMGRILPGTDLLNRNWDTPQEFIGNLGVKFAGPAGGFYSSVAGAMGELAGGNLREGMKKLPGELGALSKAIDAALLQEQNPTFGVTTKTGVRLTYDKSTGEFRDLTTQELLGMALGGTPTILSSNRDVNYSVVGETIYWQTRRGDLLDKYWRAVRTGDEVMREDVLEVISRYNDQVDDRALRITGKDRAVSVKERRRAAMLAEQYGTSAKKMRGVAGETRESFGESPRR